MALTAKRPRHKSRLNPKRRAKLARSRHLTASTSTRKASRRTVDEDRSRALLNSARSAGAKREGLRNWFTSNPSGAYNEIEFRFRDFFDSAGSNVIPGIQYLVDLNNLPGINYGGYLSKPFANLSKVTSVKLYALPRYGEDSSDSALLILSALPTYTGVIEPNTQIAANLNYVAQKATCLTPSSTVDWVLVGAWDASSTLADANVQLTSNEAGLVPIMECEVMTTDYITGADVKVQFMIEYTIAQNVPVITEVTHSIPNLATPWTGAQRAPAIGETPVIVNPTAVHNKL